MTFAPAQSAPASAADYGHGVTVPYAGYVGSYILPNGREAWCLEVDNGDPVPAYHGDLGRIDALPGQAGRFPAYTDTEGMRRMNYIMDRYGGTGGWNSAAVQIAVWALRSTGVTDRYDTVFYPALERSAEGRALLTGATAMIEDAKQHARPPVKPTAVDGSGFAFEPDPSGRVGRYRVSYPKGTTQLWTDGSGLFVRNGERSLTVDPGKADARYIDAVPGTTRIRVNGAWISEGVRGWEAKIDAWSSQTPAGVRTQSVGFAAGSSVPQRLTGEFGGKGLDVQPEEAAPKVSSQAQPSATVGGTMSDTAIVSAPAGRRAVLWPDAVLDFTAYLEPAAGAPKMDERWEPILDREHPQTRHREAPDGYAPEPGEQVIDGFVYGPDYWLDEYGRPLTDAAGAKIPAQDASGTPTAGTAADGTEYPVQARDPENGEPRLDGQGAPILLAGRDPVMETFFLPVAWTESELSAMTDLERCTAQPVHREEGIPVPALGSYSAEPTAVKSAGTIHWVERVTSPAGTHHTGRCGLANETTRIGQPGVVTRALADAKLGEEVFDVAEVSGELAEGAVYSLVFEAYRAPDVVPGADAPEPECLPQNRIFRSQAVAVTGLGEVRSPGFTARWEHGTTIWWVETLFVDSGEGPVALHRGACGLANETTTIGRPAVETRAQPNGVTGDVISDTAVVTGGLAGNDGARWELTFEGFRERYEDRPNRAEHVRPGEEQVRTPVCTAENRLFETGATAVAGAGEFASEQVIAEADWSGSVWWVETLWLIQDGTRTPVHRGDCGLPNETTRLTAPTIVTDATRFVAVGDLMRDTAVIEGSLSQREGVSHEVVFEGYRGVALEAGETAVCDADNRLFETEAVPVTGSGPVVSPDVRALPEHGETVWWVERLVMRDGDDSVELHRGECGLPDETTTIQYPKVRTEAVGTVGIGEELFDTAIVEGPLSSEEGVAFVVTFAAYERKASGMDCSPESEIAELSDRRGAIVAEPGRYESKRVTAAERHVGLGGFVETLTMTADGETHTIHVGNCGERSENFEVRPPGLATTGAAGTGPALALAALLLPVGGAALALATLRRRRTTSGEGATARP